MNFQWAGGAGTFELNDVKQDINLLSVYCCLCHNWNGRKHHKHVHKWVQLNHHHSSRVTNLMQIFPILCTNIRLKFAWKGQSTLDWMEENKRQDFWLAPRTFVTFDEREREIQFNCVISAHSSSLKRKKFTLKEKPLKVQCFGFKKKFTKANGS